VFVLLLEIVGGRIGWGGRIWGSEWRDQNPLPYHLATPNPKNQTVRPRARSSSCTGETFSPAQRNSSSAPVRAPRCVPRRSQRRRARRYRNLCRSAAPARTVPASQASATAGKRPRTTGLAIVSTARLKKGAYCDDGGISCQFRALEYVLSSHMGPRMNDHIPALG